MKPSTKLCAPIKHPSLEKIERANREADLIEFRLDLFSPKDLKKLQNYRSYCKIPVIFTIKGKNPFPYLKCHPDLVDLDFQNSASLFIEVKKRYPYLIRIASQHAEGPFSKLFSLPAEIYKAALPSDSILDSLRMVLWAKKKRRPFIGLCTGESGTITRILAPISGAPFTYAPLDEEDKTADGQLLLDELEKIYRFRKIGIHTALYGLIGDPVSQSPSHIIHNFAFQKLGLDALYVKMRVTKEELKEAVHLIRELKFQGLSVTIPHKTTIGKEIGREGIFNTLLFKKKAQAFNSDGKAALSLILENRKVKGTQIVILGTGGAALGIKEALEKEGGSVTCLNREEMKYFSKKAYDVLINATPIQNPIAFHHLQQNALVIDITLTPTPSALLIAAKEKGCRVIDGMTFFLKQAAWQYEHWFLSSSL